jgi:hypothetical protein
MNWHRLKLVFSNAHIVAVIASFGALVALPSVLQFDRDQGEQAFEFGFGFFSLGPITVEELVALQVITVLIAAVLYVGGSILTSMTMPVSVASHLHVSDFVKQKYDAVTAAHAAGQQTTLAISPGQHWAQDVELNFAWRMFITTCLVVALLAFLLSFFCSFLLLQAALLA